MSGARDQVARLLALVPMIRSRGQMHVEEAAAALDTTPGQLVNDLHTLVFCGWPGLFPGDLIEVDLDALEADGDGMIRIDNADYLTRPVRLSPAEASALVVALRTLRETADEATMPTIDSTLAKLSAATEAGDEVDLRLPEQEREQADLRRRIGDAVDRSLQLRLVYHVPARDEDTERTVDPLALVQSEGMAYLDAWCHSAGGRRAFRLDRVVSAQVLDSAVAEHPDVPPLDLAEGLFRPSPQAPVATLRLAPDARWVAEYYPVRATRDLPDGGLEVELAVADERWLTRLLLRLAPHATVVSPREFTDSFLAAATDALRLYDEAT